MPNKQETLNLLGECLKREEDIIPLYSRHIESSLFLSGFDKKTRGKISAILNKLRSDSMRHKQIFEDLIKKVKESNLDVY